VPGTRRGSGTVVRYPPPVPRPRDNGIGFYPPLTGTEDMLKHIDLLVRDSDRSHESFRERWAESYVPAVREVDGLVRYQRVLPTEPEHAEFDGLSELYFESRAALKEAVGPGGDDSAAVAGPAVADHLPVSEVRHFTGEETNQKDAVDGSADGLYKHSAFLVRQAEMSHEAFVDYWQTNHTPIARDIEGVVKYDTVIPDESASGEFDGVAELYFDDLDALYAALGGEGSRDYDPTREVAQRAREDVDNFLAIDERPRLIGTNHLVLDRT
jgi:uncharacterized protein (TIGR02118 family)